MIRQAALVACVVLAGPILAQEDNTELPKSLKPPSFEIAPEVSGYTYREPGVMKNQGTLYGVAGSYTHRIPRYGDPTRADIDSNDGISWSIIKIEGRVGFGQVEYEGSYMEDDTPLRQSGIDDFLLDVRLMCGLEWRPATRFPDGLYAGIGYRYLSDDSSSQPAGYLRESNYLYLPLGSRADFDLTDNWSLGLTGEFDLLLIGRQISHLEDADPALPEIQNWQWPGYGIRGAVAFRHTSPSLDVAISPFVRYWWIAESDVTEEGYYEPENNTFEYGLSVIFRF